MAKTVHKSIILALLAVAQFMVVLDVSIVNVALPSIQRALDFNPANLQWVVTAYGLAFGGFLLLGGRAADLFGPKRIFLWGTAFFGIASLITGLSGSSTVLIAARAVQGLAAAFMSPAALSLVITTFKEGKERNKALGVWGAVSAGGAAAGILFGGLLTEYADWRWNFFVNVPIALGVVLLAKRYVPEKREDLGHNHLDLRGAALVTTGLMLFVYGLAEAPGNGWTSASTLSFLGISFVLLALFVRNESRVEHPLMPLRLFKIRNVLGANLTQLPIMMSMFSMFFFLTLYIQNVMHFMPVKAGLSFLPVTIVIGIMSGVVANLVGKIGYKKILIVAPLLIAVSLLMFAQLPAAGGSYLTDVLPGLIIMSIGLGMSFVSLTIAATSGVPAKDSGLASGILNTSQQIGGALGLAILSGVSASKISSELAKGTDPANALIQGFHNAFYVGALFAVLASLAALTLLKHTKGEIIESAPAAIH